ncbi:hypothetical protein MRX96_022026 [Rhipicephalus microplus]
MMNAVFVLKANDSRLCKVQRKDAKLVTMIKDIEAATEMANQSKAGKSYQIVNGMLMPSVTQHVKTIQRVVVPKSLQSALMQSHHDHAGHGDALRTKSKLSKRYYWQNIDQDIAQYVRECRVCQQHNHETGVQPGTLIPREVPQTPFHTVAIDHVGPINTADENKYVITAVDAATRFIVTRAVPSKCASQVIQFIEENIVTKFGVPRTIISDNDSAFMSKTTNDYLHHHHIEHTLTVPYAPGTNGLVERANGRILPPLHKNVNGGVDHWREHLAKTTFEVSTQCYAGLKISPFELLFNYTPRRISDNQLQVDIHEPQQDIEMVLQEAFDNITAYLNGMKTKHDQKHSPAPFEVGDQVWYETSSKAGKFDPWYNGPYTITDRDKETFTITRTKNNRTETKLASATQLKCFHEKTQDTTPQLHDDSSQSTQAPLATDDRHRLRKPPRWLQDFVTD